MSGSAKVHSVEVIRDFRIAYSKLAEETRRSLDQRIIQIRKFQDWLNTDQRNYWLAELKLRRRDLDEANSAMSRKKLSSHTQAGQQHSTELTALRKAKERIELCQKKLQAIQHWSGLVEQATRDYEGQSRLMGGYLQTDVLKGLQMLDGVLQSLDAYTQTTVQPISTPSSVAPERSDEEKQ